MIYLGHHRFLHSHRHRQRGRDPLAPAPPGAVHPEALDGLVMRRLLARAAVTAVVAATIAQSVDIARSATQPAHPKRVAEAIAGPWDVMLDHVYHSDLVAGTATRPNPWCFAGVDARGVQSRTVECRVRSTTVGTWTSRGVLRPERCATRSVVFEDGSGHVTVRTQARGTWCFRFGDARIAAVPS